MIELLLLIETPEDKIKFEKLYKNIHRRLLYVALKFLHNQQDAEDIVHDVFAKIAKDYPKYRGKPEKEMLSLGFVMVRNASINLIRARERHKETPIEIKDDLLGTEADPLEDVLKEENVEVLNQALTDLNEEDKNILVLRYYHSMSYKEIGKLLGLKVKTIDMRLYRIKKRLREVISYE
ncbi:MAG: sigma-70 family RNA polymerase sigma factor [Lachnospiraceae bacterium]|nr:sigma-70 family RNA polymerase sigma factor [Lachnospiraceae bacterium]